MTKKTLAFTFEGREITAVEGQTLAGALHSAGVSVLSRSPKYHRPRGYTCGFGACGDCPLTVNGTPSVVSCITTVRGGENVRREQGFPGTGFDLIRASDLAKPLLPAGFQFRLFRKNPRLSALSGAFMAVLAGGGRMPTQDAAKSALVTNVVKGLPEVLVIGAGPSGVAAALGAADSGRLVTIVDRSFNGGRSGVRTEQITHENRPLKESAEHCRELLAEAEKNDRITLLEGTAVGLLEGTITVIAGRTRHELTPEAIIVATGSYETPALFANSDRPGVMLADAAIRLCEAEGTLPGKTIIIATDSQRGHDVARRLIARGCHVLAVVDQRHASGVQDTQTPVITGMSPQKVHGWSCVRRVTFSGNSGTKTLKADALVLAYGRRPAEELALQLAYAHTGSHLEITSDNPPLPARHLAVGSAAGHFSYDTAKIRAQSTRHFAARTR